VAGFPGQEQAGGVASAGDAQLAAGFVQMAVDGVLGNAEAARDLLGMEMIGHEAQTLPLPRREPFNRVWIVALPHKRRGKSAFGVSSIEYRYATHFDARGAVG
jgi:hypothetical protein